MQDWEKQPEHIVTLLLKHQLAGRQKQRQNSQTISRVRAGLRTHEAEIILTPTPSHVLVGPAGTVAYVRVHSFTVAGAVPGLQSGFPD